MSGSIIFTHYLKVRLVKDYKLQRKRGGINLGFGQNAPLTFKTTTMNLKDKIIHYLVYGTLCMIVYISVCIFFELHSLYKKLKQWN